MENDILIVLSTFFVISIIEFFVTKTNTPTMNQRALNIVAAVIYIVGGAQLFSLVMSLFPKMVYRTSEIANPIVYTVVLLFTADFLYYFYHRLQHKNKWLWQIHKFHHTDPNMSILTSHRTNVLEQILQELFINIPAFLILGHNTKAGIYSYIIFRFVLYFSHCNINLSFGKFSYLFISPGLHRVHHSKNPEHHHKNFAQAFPIFDILFNTYLSPKDLENIETGISEKCDLKDQAKSMLWPLWR